MRYVDFFRVLRFLYFNFFSENFDHVTMVKRAKGMYSYTTLYLCMITKFARINNYCYKVGRNKKIFVLKKPKEESLLSIFYII